MTTLEIQKKALEVALEAANKTYYDLKESARLSVQNRAIELLRDAMDVVPMDELEITCAYESIQINLKDDDGRFKEILSINYRTFGNPYLNTYSTMMDTPFEFKRLMINGKIGQLFLEDSELFERLFAPSEFKEALTQAAEEQYGVERALREVKYAIQKEKLDAVTNKLKAGEEIEFDELKVITYGRSKWDYICRVKKAKAEWVSKKKVNLILTVKGYSEEDEDRIMTCNNIGEKYVQNIVHAAV